MKILNVVGARPQFVKMALIAEEARSFKNLDFVTVHTGQHYDKNMSGDFFSKLNIPKPKYNLGIGSATHTEQISSMISGLGDIIAKERPDMVFVYGDTNSTLAGALAAKKSGVKLAHVEAGLRSFNRSMPEEINRIITDHISDILFCPTDAAIKNLHREGIFKGVFRVDDVMFDMLERYSRIAKNDSKILSKLGLKRGGFYLATIHRSYNTDDPRRLKEIISALGSIDKKVIFPVHPRTKRAIAINDIRLGKNISAIPPVSYIDMINLEMNASAILTDSGGVQKEAFFLKVPCVTLREETEWVETVKSGWNILAGVDGRKIRRALSRLTGRRKPPAAYKSGSSAKNMLKITLDHIRGKR